VRARPAAFPSGTGQGSSPWLQRAGHHPGSTKEFRAAEVCQPPPPGRTGRQAGGRADGGREQASRPPGGPPGPSGSEAGIVGDGGGGCSPGCSLLSPGPVPREAAG